MRNEKTLDIRREMCIRDRLNGLLDQGYWPDGLYTPPSDDAVEHELHTVRERGFNLLRKHAKIEPERWYYHCDKLGIICLLYTSRCV